MELDLRGRTQLDWNMGDGPWMVEPQRVEPCTDLLCYTPQHPVHKHTVSIAMGTRESTHAWIILPITHPSLGLCTMTMAHRA